MSKFDFSRKMNFSKMNPKLVERRKLWFRIPVIILIVAIIFGIGYGFGLGSPFNLSMDFTSGYSFSITLGDSRLKSDTEEQIKKEINDVFENLSNSSGMNYGLSVYSFTLQGEKQTYGYNVKYRSAGHSDSEMVTINDELQYALETALFPDDDYGGKVNMGDTVSAAVSSELIIMAICAVLMALVLMLIYIAVRFEVLSGIAAIICLAHDLIIMVAFMLIFQVSISSTFIAALITILGYSINNTIIIFDRIRDINKTADAQHMSHNQIANNAIMTTLTRSINTTLTTFITVAMVALFSAFFGVSEMIVFCLPLMVGLLAGTFSSVLLAPSIWSMWKNREERKRLENQLSRSKTSSGEQDTAVTTEPVSENNNI